MIHKTNNIKQRHNTIYVGHHYVQTNTNNVNKSCDLPTTNKDTTQYMLDTTMYKQTQIT